MSDPLITCKACGGQFLLVVSASESGFPEQVDETHCPHCETRQKVVYSADMAPSPKEYSHSGEIIIARTPYAYEFWRHNKEFFVSLRYRPRRSPNGVA